jgi:hypothetical protein
MIKRITTWVVLGLITAGVAACSVDFGSPNDTADAMERSRLNRAAATPDQLPPGLGEDLPPPPAPAAPVTNK